MGMGKIYHGGKASGDAKKGLQSDDAGYGPGTYSWSDPYFHAPNMQHYPYSGNSWRAVPKSEEQQFPLADAQLARYAAASLHSFGQQQRISRNSQPFFLAVGFHRPHLPFVFPEEKLHEYPLDTIELPDNEEPPTGMPASAWSNFFTMEMKAYDDIKALKNSSLPRLGLPGVQLPAAKVRELRRAYYASVSHMDDQIGLVLSALEESGLSNSTVVALWGDHGWELGEHGEWAKHTNFDLAVRAPFILRIPGITDCNGCPRRVTEFTEHVDIYPTLVDAAMGVKVPPCPDGEAMQAVNLCTMGHSVLEIIRGNNSGFDAGFSQYSRPYVPPGETPDQNISWCNPMEGACTMGYSMVTSLNGTEYRYAEWVDFNTPRIAKPAPDWSRMVGQELYVHGSVVAGTVVSRDLAENVNLAQHPNMSHIVGILSKRLREGPRKPGSWGAHSARFEDSVTDEVLV